LYQAAKTFSIGFKTKQLLLFSKTNVFFLRYTENTNDALCGQNAELLDIKCGVNEVSTAL